MQGYILGVPFSIGKSGCQTLARPNLSPELFSWLREKRALGNPETDCLLIGFREEQSKESPIGAFMLARGVSRRRKVQIANFLATITLRRMFS